MKSLYHICLTAHSEVLTRNLDDVRALTNGIALAAYRSDTEVMTDSVMSTHLHANANSDNTERFVTSFACSQTKSFNTRHSRKGPLFDPGHFVRRLEGPYHIQMALSYGLRQGMHHGVCATPFAYPWSTCNSLFVRERGACEEMPRFHTRNELNQFFPKNADFPDVWEADRNGILLRKSFEQLEMVQNWYGTARAYMYSMLRKTSQEWLDEQRKDNVDSPLITLDLIEKGYSSEDVSKMLLNEGNPKYVKKEMDDMSLCQIIDNEMIGRFGVGSVYQLDSKQKSKLADELRFDVGIRSDSQISRCLVMKYDR